MTKAEMLIDLSQFASEPARSGIQRVLIELIRGWPPGIVSADVGYCDKDRYSIVSLERAQSVLRNHFNGDAENVGAEQAGRLKARLEQMVTAKIPKGQLGNSYEAYLLPDVTFSDEILDVLSHWNSWRPLKTFAIFFDALPQINPQVFRAPHQMATSRYYREVANLENVACISRASLDCLIGRLRRRPATNAVVMPLGTNPIECSTVSFAPMTPTFVSVGTIEPRKNHHIILAAFKELWRSGADYRLRFIGARGWHTDKFVKEISDKRAEDPFRFQWVQQADDAEIGVALAQATAAIFLSEAEGYGLPAVEALAAGCPLIAAASLPALEGLPILGQVRLSEVSVQSVKAAVQRLADPDINNHLRSEQAKLRLPSWQDFAYRLIGWIRRTLDGKEPLTIEAGSEPLALV